MSDQKENKPILKFSVNIPTPTLLFAGDKVFNGVNKQYDTTYWLYNVIDAGVEKVFFATKFLHDTLTATPHFGVGAQGSITKVEGEGGKKTWTVALTGAGTHAYPIEVAPQLQVDNGAVPAANPLPPQPIAAQAPVPPVAQTPVSPIAQAPTPPATPTPAAVVSQSASVPESFAEQSSTADPVDDDIPTDPNMPTNNDLVGLMVECYAMAMMAWSHPSGKRIIEKLDMGQPTPEQIQTDAHSLWITKRNLGQSKPQDARFAYPIAQDNEYWTTMAPVVRYAEAEVAQAESGADFPELN